MEWGDWENWPGPHDQNLRGELNVGVAEDSWGQLLVGVFALEAYLSTVI